MKKFIESLLVCVVVICLFNCNVFATDEDTLSPYGDFDLEELLNVSVTSASGREQDLLEVSNAMTVITREDIERSGARDIAELFYKVPGMQIRRYDGHNYGLYIRRPATMLALGLLVLVDGVIVFNPMINGTMWSAIPVSLDEIERIEVIRGPGGVLYSANAVMGVINIITKSAKETKNYTSFQGGSQYYASSSTGIGGKPFEGIDLYVRGFYRFNRDDGFRKRGTKGGKKDKMEKHNFGFKAEYDISDETKFTAFVKHLTNRVSNFGVLQRPERFRQHFGMTNVAAKLQHRFSDHYDCDVNFWYNKSLVTAIEPNDIVIDSLNVNTQHNLYFDLLGTHVFSVGAELLFNFLNTSEDMMRHDNDKGQRIASAFFQEEYRPVDNFIVTLGMRVDDNTNVRNHQPSWQPRLSLMYLPKENQSIRAVASRMIRQNSFSERGFNQVLMYHPILKTMPLITYRGTQYIKPEEVITYELGYRGLLFNDKLNLDAMTYFSTIRNVVISHSTGSLPTTVDIVNNGDLMVYGFETNVEYKLLDDLFLTADYSYTHTYENKDFPSSDLEDKLATVSKNVLGVGARYTWKKLKLDVYAKYIDHINYIIYPYSRARGGKDTRITSFVKTMFRASYEFPVPGMNGVDAEMEFVANDLFCNRRVETSRGYYIDPQIYGGVRFKF